MVTAATFCNGTLVQKNVVDGHKPAIAFTEDQCHMYLYTTAAPFQNMVVKAGKMLPLQVLATRKLDKTPLWSEWKPWEGKITAGFFYTDDLVEARENYMSNGMSLEYR